jgi:hypothetical protein
MPGGVKQKPPKWQWRPMGELSIRRVFVCFEKPPHRCSAGVGKQAFPDAVIGVELPAHNRHYVAPSGTHKCRYEQLVSWTPW